MKKLVIVLIAVILAAGITVGVLAGTGVIYVAKAGEIDRDGARDAALQNANVALEQVYDLDVDRERRGGEIFYEVEFKIDGVEHHYTLNVNGEVLAHRTEVDEDYNGWQGGQHGQGGQNGGQNGQHGQNGNSGQQNYIGTAAAKEIALTAAGLTAEGTYDWDFEVERGGGTQYYEVEFKAASGYEYEVRVNAFTGEVIWSNVPAAGLISPEVARETALTHAATAYTEFAGKTPNSVDVELSYYQGTQAYEVEFECRELRMEYTYYIDAATGTVLDNYSEYDD